MPDTEQALYTYILALADDELILGHRDSEWCGNAPILEEDIAFANIALDEIGHANTWYLLLSDLAGEDPLRYPDRLAFFRPAEEYLNIQLVELPKGDWAFSMLRQYLCDAAEKTRLEFLQASAYPPLAEAAAKIRKEEIYHYRHTRAWMQRLGLGTKDSQQRLQNALEALWPYTGQIFAPAPDENLLVQASMVPGPENLRDQWTRIVKPFLQECSLTIPDEGQPDAIQRGQHSHHMQILLEEMQSVAHMEAPGDW
jgi:ring-1,2-phenylacetyl-CoA epoxidase subunit PaaC